jgi:filamentous hemagglutinin family protein
MTDNMSHTCNAGPRVIALDFINRIAMRTGYRNSLFRRLVVVVLTFDMAGNAMANPTGMTVQRGSAAATANGSQLTVTASQLAVLNWQSFNINAGETTVFNQPSPSSVVVNCINNQNPSQIYGRLQANGVVVLLNSSGFYFGPNSFVSTAGLVVSTANCLPPQNSGGGWEFNGPPPLASIVNYGQINVGQGGSVFLIADQIENHGTISAPGGTIGLAAGQTVLLSERPDGRGLSMAVTLPSGSVDNEGRLIADGGTIAMNARVVNQNGFIQANSVRNQNGVIELVASDQLNLGASSQIIACGDDSTGGSAGGNVTLKSSNEFSDSIGSQIDVIGGSQGGNGGNVEISAPNVLSLDSGIDARAQTGWTAGRLLLDPDYIILDTSGSGSAGSGTVLAGSGSGTLDLNVNTAFANLAVSQIILQALYDITLAGGTSWNLSQTIGANFGGVTGGQLTLEAGRNIVFGDGSSIFDANNWSVTLQAGYNFANNSISYGTGSIYLNGGLGMTGGGSIQTAAGNINLQAGQDILGGSGYVITTGGGSVSAHALAGSVDTGSDAQGYYFSSSASSLSQAYNLQDGLGGISTEAGGDVTLIAGGNVTSVLPGKGVYYYDGNAESPENGNDYLTAGAGAYGPQPGNVTIVAGGNVTGHYVVANGHGSIYAGAEMDANGNPVVKTDANNNPVVEKDANGNPVTDASGNPVYVYALNSTSTGSAGIDLANNGLALSLISGGWNVAAAQNILLQEINNPNGVFDGNGSYKHVFDYASDAYVNLSAGNLVQLAATVPLPRLSGANNNLPVIYPPVLNITAGDGGVILGAPGSPTTSLILFPSPQGSLTIDTTGSLVSDLNSVAGAPQLFSLIVSDAQHNQYTTTGNFGLNDHATTPIHSDSPTPIELDISGNMELVFLAVPEAAQINVGGDMINCSFQGMNVSSAPSFPVQIYEADGSTRTVTVTPDITSINVTGDIFNRSAFTDLSGVAPAQAANLVYLAQAVNDSLPATTLATSFYYDPTTQTLTYENITGNTLLNVLKLLNNLTVQQYINGVPQWADPFDTIPLTTTVSVLGDPTTPGTVAYNLLAQYNALGAVPYGAAPPPTYGYAIGGGGQFNITARTIDLGTCAGIQSEGVALYSVRGNYPLAGLFGNGGVFDHGADIAVTTTGQHTPGTSTTAGEPLGDLDMYLSSIASWDGGNISINAGGDINAGSSVLAVSTDSARGIYSTSQGDVSVIAAGDINVNGSRIATYDGGNITVESLNGSVNAGTGASTPVSVTGYYEDPVTQTVYANSPQIPFSGIVALTFPPRDAFYPAPPATLGNILVEAPNGSVTANTSGILQIALNQLKYPDATTTVLAGYELRDASGQNRLTAADIAPGDNFRNPVTPNPPYAADLVDGSGNIVGELLQGANGQDINANGSGIVASNVKLDASGNITGLIFANNNIDINAQQNVNVTALGGENVNVSSSAGTVSGTLIGGTGVNASGSSVEAALVSDNVTGTTSGQSGLGEGTAANATAQAMFSDDSAKPVVAANQTDDDERKKKGHEVVLKQKTGRVTVLLPPKNLSQNQTSNDRI